MAGVDLSDGWTAGGGVTGAQAALNAFLADRGMWVIGEQAGEVHARQGWWPARVVGPRLAPAAWLPKRAVVKLHATPDGVGVRARIEAPAGPLDRRLEEKYRAYFARWMSALKRRLR